MRTSEQVNVKCRRGSDFKGRVVGRRRDGLYWIMREAKIKCKGRKKLEFFALHLCRRTDSIDELPPNVPFIWLNNVDEGRSFPSFGDLLEHMKKDEALTSHVG